MKADGMPIAYFYNYLILHTTFFINVSVKLE
jgi:hypothetical protein